MRKKLGKVREDYYNASLAGRVIYLSKHSFDCGWYWGFGYIGNNHLHTHFSYILERPQLVTDVFSDTSITEATWWNIQDLFKQAYILKEYAGLCRHNNGYIASSAACKILSLTSEDEKLTNERLELVLDTVWALI